MSALWKLHFSPVGLWHPCSDQANGKLLYVTATEASSQSTQGDRSVSMVQMVYTGASEVDRTLFVIMYRYLEL
jgi:hypothetical protein